MSFTRSSAFLDPAERIVYVLRVKTFCTEAIVLPENKIALEHVPFVEGENVAVFLMAIKKGQSKTVASNLHGSVLSYESPFDPAVRDEWEALA